MERIEACTTCGKPIGAREDRKYYGDGAHRHWPRCVRRFERELNARRDGKTGRLTPRVKGGGA